MFKLRKKRFWFIAVPLAFFLSMAITLVILFQIPGLRRHQLKIGSWTLLKVDAWFREPDSMILDPFDPAITAEAHQAQDEKVLQEARQSPGGEWCHGRLVQVGPFRMQSTHHPAGLKWNDPLDPFSTATIKPGARLVANKSDGAGFACRSEKWDFAATIGGSFFPAYFRRYGD